MEHSEAIRLVTQELDRINSIALKFSTFKRRRATPGRIDSVQKLADSLSCFKNANLEAGKQLGIDVAAIARKLADEMEAYIAG